MPIPAQTHLLIGKIIVLAAAVPLSAADWPTYQRDDARSAATTDQLPSHLAFRWTYRAPTRPRCAWDEPAIWDGWSKTHDLTNRQEFDKAFHVAVVGDRVYFGSSVDDQIHCLHASTGETQWTFFTEGPVRLAPTVADGRVYAGSDDGFVYCLDADTGRLIWRHRPGPSARRVAGNERVISAWPIRTGVVVRDGRVYCGAGVIPSDGVFICALTADTGEEIWQTRMNDLPAQGYLLASATRLYVVTSRDRPVVFSADDGTRLKQVAGGTGGTYALLTGDTLFYGPNKTGDVSMVQPGESEQDVLASFAGHHMIVAQPFSYLHSRDQLSSLDRQSYVTLYAQRATVAAQRGKLAAKLRSAEAAQIEPLKQQVAKLDDQIQQLSEQIQACLRWTTTCDCRHALILADQTLVAGGNGRIVGVDANTGETQWEHPVDGNVYGLAAANGRLFVSTDQGTIHCLDAATDADQTPKHADEPTPNQPYLGPFKTKELPPMELIGPFAEFVADGIVNVTWETTEPMTSELEWNPDADNSQRFSDDTFKTQHQLSVSGVPHATMHHYQVGGQSEAGHSIRTEAYRFDAHFYYRPVATIAPSSPYENDNRDQRLAAIAKTITQDDALRRGYALVVGSRDGQLAFHLAQNSELQIVVIESDPDAVRRIRQRLAPTGLYGSRISVHQRPLQQLPYGPFLANLIVCQPQSDGQPPAIGLQDLYRCLRPAGGQLIVGGLQIDPAAWDDWRNQHQLPVAWEATSWSDGDFWRHRRDKLPGTAEWTHQYALPDNSSCSGDDQVRGPLSVSWWGKPGARPMPDRGNRNPPPVSANGRLYVQGNRTLFGLDAYNGTVLWAKQIPNMRRANLPRDGSNMVATDQHVWVSVGAHCVAFDGQTGERQVTRELPDDNDEASSYQWGYLARVGESLLGSGVKRGAHYVGDAGEWYEGGENRDVARVTSDFLFAGAWYGGPPRWRYQRGAILNSTITIADGVVYLIESRSEAARQQPSGRLLDEILQEQFLVAIDLQTGEVLWEKPYDFSQCYHVTYMTHGQSVLLVAGTNRERVFHVYAFRADNGEQLWTHQAKDLKGHHTGHLAHPTIVGDRVYFNKHAYDLLSGEVLYVHDFNWHGCGVMSASNHTVFSRYEYHGMYDLKTRKRTELLGIRSGCWLSLIPSGGLLLAPETSAGCSCGHSLQTSVAYLPTHLLD